jgi:hypothetical protein
MAVYDINRLRVSYRSAVVDAAANRPLARLG